MQQAIEDGSGDHRLPNTVPRSPTLRLLMKNAFREYDLRVVNVRIPAHDLFSEVAEALPGI